MYLFIKVSLLNNKNNYKKYNNLFLTITNNNWFMRNKNNCKKYNNFFLIKFSIINETFKIKYKKTNIIFNN